MTEDDYAALALEHANGRPLRDILAEVYDSGHVDGYGEGYDAGYQDG